MTQLLFPIGIIRKMGDLTSLHTSYHQSFAHCGADSNAPPSYNALLRRCTPCKPPDTCGLTPHTIRQIKRYNWLWTRGEATRREENRREGFVPRSSRRLSSQQSSRKARSSPTSLLPFSPLSPGPTAAHPFDVSSSSRASARPPWSCTINFLVNFSGSPPPAGRPAAFPQSSGIVLTDFSPMLDLQEAAGLPFFCHSSCNIVL